MATLLFYDEGHRYEVDGAEVPSVSELCRFISREVYGDVTQWRLDNAADRGTRVHKACEILDLYGKADVDDDIVPYLQAYLQFRKEHGVAYTMIEKSLFHPVENYAGTIDRAGTVDGKPAIVDIKTSCTVQKRLALAQLNFYRRMLELDTPAEYSLYILHLSPDGTYKLIPIDRNDDVPNALLTLHRLMEKKRRKKMSREIIQKVQQIDEPANRAGYVMAVKKGDDSLL